MTILTPPDVVDRLLDFCSQPYLKVALELAKAAKIFLEGDSVQSAVRTVADSKLRSAERAMQEMERKEDTRSAGEGILTDLRGAYYLFESYYTKMPQEMKTYIPGLWEFNKLHMSVRGTVEVQDTIARICFLKAVYHKALGNDPSLVREWLCDMLIPCDNYKILVGMLGREVAMEYIASNPLAGRRVAEQYLAGKNIPLENYGKKCLPKSN